MERTFLAYDIECCDPNLRTLGNGVYRRDGYILGVSFADDTGYNEYLNLGHEGISNSEKVKNMAKVRALLASPCPKVAANSLYDLDWLVNGYGFEVNGELHDIIQLESLLDEYRASYSLDAIAHTHLGRTKEKGGIEAFCEERGMKGDPRAHLYKMPYRLVATYAKMDTALLIPLFQLRTKVLKEEGLVPLYDIERAAFPLLLAMRKHGVRVDENRRQEVCALHTRDLEQRERNWYARFPGVNYNSTKQLAALFDSMGIPYDLSNGGKKELLSRLNREVDDKRLAGLDANDLFEELGIAGEDRNHFYKEYPSITHDTLENLADDYPIAKEVEELKRVSKVLGTFVGDGGVLDRFQVEGRIHANFNPFSSDEGGTVSGRLSSSNPNLQQISAKKGDFDPLVRSCFIPEEGHLWGKCDFSQIEYRIIAHFAKGEGAEDIQERYRRDPHTDYHKVVQELAGIDRTTAKRLNFGLAYFMGARSMSRKFHWPLEKAQELVEQYALTVPFLFPTREAVVQVAKARGYIRTMLGRRCRMSPAIKKLKKEYVAFNRLIQGTAADLMKKSMADAWKKGLFNVLVPHLTVHDELDVSIPQTNEGLEAYAELKHTMEEAMSFRVPVIAEAEIGPNWGTLHSFEGGNR